MLFDTTRCGPPRPRFRPRLECLEDRCLLSGITKVHDLGTVTAPESTTTVNLTLTAPVTAGDSILVEIVTLQGVTTGAVTVSDGAGNAYTKDADISPAFDELRTLVFSTHHAHPLAAGGTLTIKLAGGSGNQHMTVASAVEFASLGAIVPVDVSHSAAGANASPSSGPTTTTFANDLLLGAVGVLFRNIAGGANPSVAFTPGGGYTALASATSADFVTRLDLVSEYRIVSATGAFVADGAFGERRTWAATLVAYRGLDTPPAPASSDLPPGLTDVTAAVTVTPRKPVLFANGRMRLRLTLHNSSGNTHTGPLSLVLTNLPRKARLRKGSGFTALVPPVGRPYLSVQPGGDGLFSPGEVLHVTLELTGRFPRKFRPTFRIVAGAGVR